jgi:hypothetical protein
MKKTYTLFALLFFSTLLLAQSKLSAPTRLYLESIKPDQEQTFIQANYVYKRIDAATYISAFALVNKNVDESAIDALGVKIGTKAGDVWVLQVPPAKLQALSLVRGLQYLELDQACYVTLDSARKATRVDSVHQGIALPMAYSGKDVIVGIIDVGFDYTHPMYYDTSGQICRIKRVWEEHRTGTPPAGFAYGNELRDTTAYQSMHTDNNLYSHGSHVTGIAAGSGYKSSADGSRYRGMAFESDVVMVGILPDSFQWQNTGLTDMVDGINYIYQYAASVHKSAVANLSWGSSLGPHDGSSLFSRAVDALTGTGKIFVLSAGNEGDGMLHISKNFDRSDTLIQSFVNFDSYLADKSTWLDVWGDSGKSFCLQATLYNHSAGSSSGYVCLDNGLHHFKLIGSDGDSVLISMTMSTSDFNHKSHAFLSLYSNTADTILFSMKSNDGMVHAWIGYVRAATGYYGTFQSNNYPWATAGNADMSISEIAATRSGIAVGAYASKVRYRTITFSSYNLGSYAPKGTLVPFSSHGPTLDGRVKPDIAGPGLALVSSVNSWDANYNVGGADYASSVISAVYDSVHGRNYYYAQMSGTSMSSPAVSGIVALMLQANPNLTPANVTDILARTAILDTFTGVLPAAGNSQWGHGKVNAYAAVIAAASYVTSAKDPLANVLPFSIYPNPADKVSFIIAKESISKASVYDMQGKNMHINFDQNNYSFDLGNLPSGIYVVEVEMGGKVYSVKMLKL